MAETTTMRVIPSGKIYRQMFDAQVQLNKSLTAVPKRPKSPSTRQSVSATNSVPLVRLNTDETKHGVLTERQQTWVNGFPNEPHIENPVLYRQYADYMSRKLRSQEALVYDEEVQALPDIVVPTKKGSDIIDRIASSRKERHEAAVEDMQQEFNVISSNFEPCITEASESILNQLESDDEELTELLNQISTDEDLIGLELYELERIWEEVQSHSPSRQGWILQLDQTLKTLEDNRTQQIRSVFEVYSDKLEKIAHLLAPDLQKYLDKEAQNMNKVMLSNRRAFADLFVRLMSADIEREKTQYALWKRRKEDWSALKTKKYVDEFKVFMKSEEVTKPEGVDTVLENMLEDQQTLNIKRLDLVQSLVDMKPPMSTKTSVFKWNQTMKSLSQEIETINQKHLSKLHEEYELICQTCIDRMNKVKERLINEGVCTPVKSQSVVDIQMLPLVGEQQKTFEENLEVMENALETHGLTMTTDIKSLFKFSQGAAHVWDVHEIGLAKQERALQEKLENCRQEHDSKNQETEAMLDNIMDKMRQDGNEQNLATSLVKSLEMLERIRLSYEVFHQKQTDIVKTYPEMVTSELSNYDDSVCKFFLVDRIHPDDRPESVDSEGRNSQASVSSQEEKKKERKKKRRASRVKDMSEMRILLNYFGCSL
ncbi:hypothetical protein LOTGIDRAFT_156277 [Lottia gigantea]|uniref:DUF4455 domain-containing protein n=1 Tax=Lottia gigantea TaxID=225164 RepID=V4BGN1_LOTGI|nr:hypothetical protein LOTGIDRAFT_156277 [Lottia gigantea]ESP05022.1 hypothetical protein LOTGIDRAFT_156277 [Lottia gigantea]